MTDAHTGDPAERVRTSTGIRAYRLGCPLWSMAEWQGSLYEADGRPSGWLRQYARVFNTVEGNTTFYAVPTEQTVARWLHQTPDDFHFCFKFPRTISHDRPLADGIEAAHGFLHRMRPLGSRLGPFMLQLPARVGPGSLAQLTMFLASLPSDVACAVEFRHRSFFDDEVVCSETDHLLREQGAERIILDSRPMRSGSPLHPDVVSAEHRKPDLPVLPRAIGQQPLVRFIAHPEDAITLPWIDTWCGHLFEWMRLGHEPLLLMHCPNNAHSPHLARLFHFRLRLRCAEEIDVGTMAAWPGEQGGEQLSLV